MLSSYYKFMVVRHPLTRLVSAYNDKIIGGGDRQGFQPVIRVIRQQHNKAENTTVTFSDFLEYILELSPRRLNQHWRPISMVCDPCHVEYDKIIKLETQKEDLREIFSRLGPYRRNGDDVHANKQTPENDSEMKSSSKQLSFDTQANQTQTTTLNKITHTKSNISISQKHMKKDNHKTISLATKIPGRKTYSSSHSLYSMIDNKLVERILSAGFGIDMMMFGYNWTNNYSGFTAKCADEISGCC